MNQVQMIPVSAGVGRTGRQIVYLPVGSSEELALGKTRPLILMCPGGGYQRTSDREAEPMALTFMAMGYHVAVLRYSCGEEFIIRLRFLQLARAWQLYGNMQKVGSPERTRLLYRDVRPEAIWQQGWAFSGKRRDAMENARRRGRAGKTNGLMLSYPVITAGEFAHRPSIDRLLGENLANCERMLEEQSLEKHVSEDVPVTFLWHTLTDTTVPAENSLLFLSALRKAHVPAEFHLYPEGGHGWALANRLTMAPGGKGIAEGCESWVDLAKTWLYHYFPWDGK